MARRKSTSTAAASTESTVTVEATSEAQATETSENTASETVAANETVQTKTKAKTTSEAASYTVTWAKMAGRTIKGIKGVLVTFDGEGKAVVDADNARRFAKMRGATVEGL